jgi:decaprenyl-phosphate phosphoribosyltransferase
VDGVDAMTSETATATNGESVAEHDPVLADLGSPAGSAGTDHRASEPGDAGKRRPSLAVGLLKLARPKQWAKNVLVFGAPGAAGVLDNARPLLETVVAFVSFCLVAAGTYYLNDARDAEADRLHPTKRHRPIAAGIVPVRVAVVGGVLLLAAGIGLALVDNAALAATVTGYVVLTTAYSLWLKEVAVVDLVAIAAGFVLRAVAGAVATDLPQITSWFFIVTIFGSLFIVAGKRGAEAAEMGDEATSFRAVLGAYSNDFTAYLRSVTSSALLVSYCMWAFEKAEQANTDLPWYQMSILPFVMAVLRYALVLDQGKGSAPEDIILGDRILQLIGAGWVAIFAIGVYTG